jgi:hypothetical protein
MTRTPENYGDATSGVSYLMLAPLTLRSGSTARGGYRSGKEMLFSLRVPTPSAAAEEGGYVNLDAR